MDNAWLQYGPASNKFKQTYVRGFMDVSGNIIIRNGGLNITNGNVIGITKAMVGLSNVDNTTDVDKPISTSQQTALDLKSTIASPTFTGIVTTPATSITNTTASTDTSTGALQVTGGVGIGGSVNIGGNTRIYGGLTVDGSFNVTGGVINTTVKETVRVSERVDISNSGTGPGLTVRQYGTAPIAEFFDDTTIIMQIEDGGDVSMNKQLFVRGITSIKNTTASTSTSTGALQVVGGAGILGNVYVGGNIHLGLGNNIYINGVTSTSTGNVLATSNVASTNTSTGALRVVGGAGITGNVYVGGNLIVSGTISGTGLSTGGGGGGVADGSVTGAKIAQATINGNNLDTGIIISTSGTITSTNPTVSTSVTSGALRLIGGVGIGGNANIGGLCKIDGLGWTDLLVAVSDMGYGSSDSTDGIYTSIDGINWNKMNIGNVNDIASCIKYNGSYWLAYSRYYSVFIKSYDSLTWTADQANDGQIPSNIPFEFGWNGSYWLGAHIESGTTTRISKSTDGLNWTTNYGYVDITSALHSLVWNPNISKWFITYQSDYRYATSSNGINWTMYESDVTWYDTDSDALIDSGGATGNTNTIALGYFPMKIKLGSSKMLGFGSVSLAYSSDGITWFATFAPANFDSMDWNGIQWMAAVAGEISTSSDGITWSTIYTYDGTTVVTGSPLFLRWIDLYWILYTTDGVYKSTDDGYTWSLENSTLVPTSYIAIERSSGTNLTEQSTSTTSGALVVGGGAGIGGNLYVGGSAFITAATTSTNVSTGALVVAGGVGIGGELNVRGICFIDQPTNYSSKIMVGVVNADIYTSFDGINWNLKSDEGGTKDILRYNGTYWLAYNQADRLFSKSHDGLKWKSYYKEQVYIPANIHFEFGWGGNQWLGAYVQNGNTSVVQSLDGVNWVSIGYVDTTISTIVSSITWNSRPFKWFITFASDYKYATSVDGITWTVCEETSSWNDTYSNNNDVNSNTIASGYVPSKIFGDTSSIYIIGYTNQLIYSSDGITWSNATVTTTNSLCYGQNLTWDYTAGWLCDQPGDSSYGNDILTSSDGISWTIAFTPDVNNNFNNGAIIQIKRSSNYWLVYTELGDIYKSLTDGATWTFIKSGGPLVTSIIDGDSALLAVGGKASFVGDVGVLANASIGGKLITDSLTVSNQITLPNNSITGDNLVSNIRINTTGAIITTNATSSTDTSTGALKVSGGVGIGGNVYVGGSVIRYNRASPLYNTVPNYDNTMIGFINTATITYPNTSTNVIATYTAPAGTWNIQVMLNMNAGPSIINVRNATTVVGFITYITSTTDWYSGSVITVVLNGTATLDIIPLAAGVTGTNASGAGQSVKFIRIA